MKTIRVKAAAGLIFPREENPHRYIEQEIIEVPDSTYYRRAILDGDLILVTSEPEPKAALEADQVKEVKETKKAGKGA
ncbi:DUF2635 domain-containing protein [Neisseria sp. Ec49-e6-T10]|uniref:DUF2635 domain-containing protein n=1 Tax=Neisseria sp. Ec49-e6-T10 TaxID=3140744 RepID=UPI003EB76FC2